MDTPAVTRPLAPALRAPAPPAQPAVGGRFGRGAQPPSERITRRTFLGVAGAGAAVVALGGCAASTKGDFMPEASRRVVVTGGGWGGATAAKYVRAEDPAIDVVALEPNRSFVSCPFSNLVLSGVRTIDSMTFGYDGLGKRGVKLIHESAAAIEPDRRRVRVGEGY